MSERIIVLAGTEEKNAVITENILRNAAALSCISDTVYICCRQDNGFQSDNRVFIQVPVECDSNSKIYNFILDRFENERKFIHIIDGATEIRKDPSTFVKDLEHTMDVLDYGVWFATVTDIMNYMYKKYNPRIHIEMDSEECRALGINGLNFTSHSNTQWMVFDGRHDGVKMQRFDGRFSVAMYYIIEFLARRRQTKLPGQLYFMNQYLTVDSERGVFGNLDNYKAPEIKPDTMKQEDQLFQSLKVDYHPDNNVDEVLNILYNKIKEKANKLV